MKGQFIVLEGTDGTGKGTQFEKLIGRLRSEDFDVATFDFPQYGHPSAFFVERYLNGKYGTVDEIGPYRGSIFYAMDRYEASFAIRESLERGQIVIANRYVASNMGHQGGKISDEHERIKYFEWLDELEFNILGIAKPDLNIVLHVPAAIAQTLIDQKAKREYIEQGKRDIHENDLGHLERAEQVYLEICEKFPKTFTKIECAENGNILSIEKIHERIWATVQLLLRREK
ncbi:MAG: dTMP kinase [Candidatus Saccharimonadia bacterium]